MTNYLSTRGGVTDATFEDVLLAGLAPDGGLYVPATWPVLSEADIADLADASYADVVAVVVARFAGNTLNGDEVRSLTVEAYDNFASETVAPLTQIDDNLHLLELFWGPSFSFKDFALQLLGPMMDGVLTRRGDRMTIVGATSGDTGSAAIAAFANRTAADIVILHPQGRVSDVQRRQMTTVDAANVLNIAIDGTFDDCQDLVKSMFADEAFRSDVRLSAVNSINFGRIMAQVAYYVWTYLKLGRQPFAVSVPTGNFGNVYAAYAATALGVPIETIVVANNANNGLTKLLTTGSMSIQPVQPTVTPAMDIAVPSNFERLLFDVFGRDPELLSSTMADFRSRGVLNVPAAELGGVGALFRAGWMSDDAIIGYMGEIYQRYGLTVDPHTAVGIAVARMRADGAEVPMVAVGTAHPAKFPDAVMRATGSLPDEPATIAAVKTLPEHYESMDAELVAIQDRIRSFIG